VITNLVTNAINYTPSGGEVKVATGLWQRDSEGWRVVGALPTPEQIDAEPPQGKWVALCVSDTGKGISAADLPRLFERFFRGEAERSDVPGTGLGLAIVKEIVDRHHGQIFVHSQVGRGTTFVVLLPPFQEGKRPLVLIAEDEEDIHLALENFLHWADMEVDHAFDGQEALEQIQARRPDLLLLDLNMPRLDGYQVIERVRADEATKDLPILVLTSWAHDRAERALDFGADEFLTKPFSGDVLIDVIRRLLNQ
jgi:CheY-like chemotaxis protein